MILSGPVCECYLRWIASPTLCFVLLKAKHLAAPANKVLQFKNLPDCLLRSLLPLERRSSARKSARRWQQSPVVCLARKKNKRSGELNKRQ